MEYVDYLREKRWELYKISTVELEEKIEHYKEKVLHLNTQT